MEHSNGDNFPATDGNARVVVLNVVLAKKVYFLDSYLPTCVAY